MRAQPPPLAWGPGVCAQVGDTTAVFPFARKAEHVPRYTGRTLARPPAWAALVKGTQDSHRTDAGS